MVKARVKVMGARVVEDARVAGAMTTCTCCTKLGTQRDRLTACTGNELNGCMNEGAKAHWGARPKKSPKPKMILAD